MTIDSLQQAASPLEASGTQRKAKPQQADAPEQPVRQAAREVKAENRPASPVAPSEVNLAYHVDGKTNQIYFQVVDSRSGQVIRQVPSEQVLALESQITQFLEAGKNGDKHPAGK